MSDSGTRPVASSLTGANLVSVSIGYKHICYTALVLFSSFLGHSMAEGGTSNTSPVTHCAVLTGFQLNTGSYIDWQVLEDFSTNV